MAEEKKDVPDMVLKSSRPIGAKNRIDRPIQVAFMHDNVIETIGRSIVVSSVIDIVDFVIGTNTIVIGDIFDFHVFLEKTLDCKHLFLDRSLSDSGRTIFAADAFGTFFTVRKGNDWGSLYCPEEEDITLENAQEHFERKLSIIKNSGWDIDRLMPHHKMAADLMKRKTVSYTLPNISEGDIDLIHIERAYNSFRGSRMEAAAIGGFDKIYSMDMNSAFLSVMKDLPSIHPGFVRWIDSKDYHKDALMGFVYCKIDISDSCPIGLLATRLSIHGMPSRLFFNIGESVGWRTKDEIDFVVNSGFGSVEIYEGSWAVPIRSDVPKPYTDMVDILESLMGDNDVRFDAKCIAATSWGKFISVFPRNTLWNPMYASEITAKVRVKLSELALAHYKDLIAVAIDGIELRMDPSEVMVSGAFVGGMKKKFRSRMLSLSDYYRYDPSERYTWELDDHGVVIRMQKDLMHVVFNGGRVGDDLPEVVIPFGSAKRNCPAGLTLKNIEDNQISLLPPDPTDCAMLYFEQSELFPFNVGM